MAKGTAALGALALLLVAQPASAYVRTVTSSGAPMYWNRTVMQITAYLGNPPSDMTAGEILTAVNAAAATWSRGAVPCTSVEVRVTSTGEESADVALDGVSRLTFRRQQWCKEPRSPSEPCYAPEAMAVTSVFARRETGEILDADMEINAVQSVWSDLVLRPDDAAVAQDLQNTLTHEFGHFIGLDHTCILNGDGEGRMDDHGRPVPDCATAPPAIRETTMFAVVGPGDLDRRSLTDDDMNAVCDVYPPLDHELLAENAGCAVAGSPSAAPGTLALMGLGLLMAARRRRRAAPPPPATRSSSCHSPRR
jgi:MYXO-CTERM domain-containing protein